MNFFETYFSNKNYGWMYLHIFLYNICRSVLYIFTAGFLYQQGLSIPLILLFFGFEFGLRGLLSPVGVVTMQKIGRNQALITAAVLFSLFYLSLGLVEFSLWWTLLALILHGAAGSLYHPFADIMSAYYVKEDNRGRQEAMMHILASLGAVVGGVLGGFILELYSFLYLASICSILILLSQWALCQLTVFRPQEDFSLSSFLKFYASPEFKPYFTPFLGLQLTIIMNIVFIPLFLYLQVQNFQVLGILVALVVTMEFIINLLFGSLIDRLGVKKLLPITAMLSWGSVIAYSFFVNSGVSAFFAESYSKMVRSLFRNAFNTQLNRKIKVDFNDKILFAGTAYQLTLCLFELFFLSGLAALAFFIGDAIFVVGFVLGGFGFLICTYALSRGEFKRFQKLENR